MTDGAEEARELRDWLERNEDAPHQWRAVAVRLASHPDMPAAWRQIRKRRGDAVVIFSFVVDALASASREVFKPFTPDEGQRRIKRVIRLAGELKAAIEESPLPPDSGQFVTVPAAGKTQSQILMLGWRDLRRDGYGFGIPLAMVDLLKAAAEMAEKHLESEPPRAITRRRGDQSSALVSAFVRWLTFAMAREFQAEMHGTVALLVTAALDLPEPLDKVRVQAILKDCPPAFRLNAEARGR